MGSARTAGHERVAAEVVDALGLHFADFAASPDAVYNAKARTERALRDLVEYRLYLDLQRGWRITMPNLEQTGLLRVGYESLAQIAADQSLWAKALQPIRDARDGHREELCRIVLDEFRKVLAVDVDCLTEPGFDRIKRQSSQELTGVWAVPANEEVTAVGTVFVFPGQPGKGRNDLHLTGRSALGRYLSRQFTGPDRLGSDDAQRIIQDILAVLTRAGLLTEVDGSHGRRGYRLKASAWSGQPAMASAAPDRSERPWTPHTGSRANVFFRTLYRGWRELRGLSAREHTAQVGPERRNVSTPSVGHAAAALLLTDHGTRRRHLQLERGRPA